jgi:hypothetical protein
VGSSKYGAIGVWDGPLYFPSKMEHKRYCELKLMLAGGIIKDLEIHPSYNVIINGRKCCRVELDFKYYDNEKKCVINEDVKGFDTPISKLKRKLVQASYPEMIVNVLTAK